MTRTVTEESFLKDVARHEMTIIRDDGVHRHIRMKQPQTSNMYFDIVTYPHYLVYSGDMGCYVFSRINDMFEFFRSGLRQPGKLLINEGYWSEKLEASDRADGHKEYSSDKFRAYTQAWFDEHDVESDDTVDLHESDDARAERMNETKEVLRQKLQTEVLNHADDNEFAARDALADFEWRGRRPFKDSWEVNFNEYTFRFLWCCYAIVWSIRKYDEARHTAS